MEIELAWTRETIARPQAWAAPMSPEIGSLVEFFGLVRATEEGGEIAALHYEAYDAMAEKVMREKIALLEKRHPCEAIRVVHRLGEVRVGEAAIYVGIRSRHRGEGFRLLQDFMDELKRDVPIWKRVA
jgi:molybdopterin synthase catalytic subunit